MILDEPTAYLDLPRRIETLGLLRRLVRERGIGVLLSTHHLDLALSHADRVWLLPLGGPLSTGAPEDLALSGALERTFVSDRLVFDRADGSFGLREEPARAAVLIEGDGLARRWVERALRREGLAAIEAVVAPSPRAVARVRVSDREPRYCVEIDGARFECATIGDLVRRLRAVRDTREEDRT
jgi:iron complex transport system ATP-binding protein